MHGARGRSGDNWLWLNFPTADEEAYAAQQGIPSAKQKSAVAEGAAQGFTSEFVRVHWAKQTGRWRPTIGHDGKRHSLGLFIDEQEAARRLRPKDKPHGVLSGKKWLRLNFPTAVEEAFAKGKGMPPQKKQKVQA